MQHRLLMPCIFTLVCLLCLLLSAPLRSAEQISAAVFTVTLNNGDKYQASLLTPGLELRASMGTITLRPQDILLLTRAPNSTSRRWHVELRGGASLDGALLVQRLRMQLSAVGSMVSVDTAQLFSLRAQGYPL